jgi:hypothetical protein
MTEEDKKIKTAQPAAEAPAAKPVDLEFEARLRGERAKVSAPVAPPTRIRRKPEPLTTVDEKKSVAVKVVHSTIIFRPHQDIFSERLYKLAVECGVRLRNIRKGD